MAAFKSREELIAAEMGLKEAIEKRHGKAAEELCREREKRIDAAMRLKEPDRVPVVFWDVPLLACRYAGLTYAAAYYDAPAWKAAFKTMLADLEPDGWAVAGRESGAVLVARKPLFSLAAIHRLEFFVVSQVPFQCSGSQQKMYSRP